MDARKIAQDTTQVLRSYLTFQAIRLIIQQLAETNPQKSIWLRQLMNENWRQDGEAFLQSLMLEHKDMVLRIIKVREVIAESVVDFLPGMMRSQLAASSLDLRRQLLERLTQTTVAEDETDTSSQELPPDQSLSS
ncbi:MAG: chaperonin family protein RbcX [Cyanobacteria bacterium P01_H01_bin.15]